MLPCSSLCHLVNMLVHYRAQQATAFLPAICLYTVHADDLYPCVGSTFACQVLMSNAAAACVSKFSILNALDMHSIYRTCKGKTFVSAPVLIADLMQKLESDK